MEFDPRQLKAKCKRMVEDNLEILEYIVKDEITKISNPKIDASSEFELTKKYFTNEGIKEGLRRFVQKLNEYASKDV